jgi:magnesium transporter
MGNEREKIRMLSFHPEKGGTETARDVVTLPPSLTWIDALRPDAREIAFLERALGIKVPSLETLSEIETSSRLRSNKEWLHLSIPMIYQKDGFLPTVTPLGFAVSKDLLLTVRFKPMKAFETVRDNLLHTPMEPGGPGALIAVLEAIVDHAADMLESTGVDLDHLSEEIFGTNGAGPGRHRPREDADQLRMVMRKIGRYGDLTSKVADLLLGIGRLVPFVLVNAAPFLETGAHAKLKSLQRDINSLDDYETHLTDKIHFLLDATLGLTNRTIFSGY